jgi:hypothetical protein
MTCWHALAEAVDRVIPKRSGSRRKGEKRVAVLGTKELFEMFACNDVNDTLLQKHAAIRVQPFVRGGWQKAYLRSPRQWRHRSRPDSKRGR